MEMQLYSAPVECRVDGQGRRALLILLCLLDQCCIVYRPGEVVCDVHPQELGAADQLHSHVVDERSVAGLLLPEVNNDLFGFVHMSCHCP